MKSTSKLIGFIGFIIFFAGIFFKQFHLVGAGVLIVLGSAFGIVYFASHLFSKKKSEYKTCEKVRGTMASIAMIVFFVSFTFKMQHWSGSGILLGISMLSFLFYMIPLIKSILTNDHDANQEVVDIYKFSILYMAAVLIMFGMKSY